MFKSRLHIVVRVVLALGVCLLTWLCVQQAVEIEQLKRDLIQALQQILQNLTYLDYFGNIQLYCLSLRSPLPLRRCFIYLFPRCSTEP